MNSIAVTWNSPSEKPKQEISWWLLVFSNNSNSTGSFKTAVIVSRQRLESITIISYEPEFNPKIVSIFILLK